MFAEREINFHEVDVTVICPEFKLVPALIELILERKANCVELSDNDAFDFKHQDS